MFSSSISYVKLITIFFVEYCGNSLVSYYITIGVIRRWEGVFSTQNSKLAPSKAKNLNISIFYQNKITLFL